MSTIGGLLDRRHSRQETGVNGRANWQDQRRGQFRFFRYLQLQRPRGDPPARINSLRMQPFGLGCDADPAAEDLIWGLS